MALGFGFNKAKVLAQAERFVQQGKLPHAIAEYEKIIKEDPKDLTVLNTVGDLCARVGENEHAAHYFKTVADQYAQDGFTVKAIAIYKKLTKLSPGNYENISKLGELYSQQGLFNDARTQYMQVADHLLRSGDNSSAARIFQRILELDPENTVTQTKLADLYMKLGKKAEARNIYYTAAQALYARGSHEAAGEALMRVLVLDPENPQALMLRGMIASDAGDAASATKYLGQIHDLDSRPDGLRALFRAKLQAGDAAGAEATALKLLTLHKDLSGLNALAQWYLENRQVANVLKLFDRYEDRFLEGDRARFQAMLQPLIGKIKDSPEALNTMQRLMQRADDTSHNAELMEMQAHALAQKGDLRQARDLYLKLSEIEPENALHAQSYRQILTRLGEDSATRALSPAEAAQAFMVEELDEGTQVHQSYDPPTEQAIEAALTDAELYVSYNVPAKAIPPLEAVLPMAPRDIGINQRLAVLYSRGERYADAAHVCQVLSEVYHELGHEKDAVRYQEAARRYALRIPGASAPPPPLAVRAVPHVAGTAPPLAPPPVTIPAASSAPEAVMASTPPEPPAEAPSVQEFSFDVPDHLLTVEPPAPPTPVEDPAEAETSSSSETDLSGEWESMLSVESEEAPAPPQVAEMPVVAPVELTPVEQAPSAVSLVTEKIEEIRFYIGQEMWDAAKKAILDLTEISPDAPEAPELIAAVSAGQSQAAAFSHAPPVPPPALLPAFGHLEPFSASGQVFDLVAEDNLAPANAPVAEFQVDIGNDTASPVEIVAEALPPKVHAAPAPEADIPAAKKKPRMEAAAAPEVAPPIAPPSKGRKREPDAHEKSPLEDIFAAPLPAGPLRSPQARPKPAPEPSAESPLGDLLDIPSPPKPSKRGKMIPPAAAAREQSTEDILSDFLLDLERTELADFVPRSKPEPVASPLAMPATPAHNGRKNGDMQDAESASVLSDILAELQEEAAGGAGPPDDAETHYNLGIAFKEMGLLDEAIGELQKVCHAVDKGNEFSQPIQAYTWLAQCLVDKGAPEAAVRWYQQALHLPSLDDGSRCAIYYDLAQAYEASGDKKSALASFMEVYGSNIDFRDVASRIKALKS